MKAVLIDTGPIVAFLNRRDRHHSWAVEVLASLQPPLQTCDAVLSEATYLLRDRPTGPERVLELLSRGMLQASFRLADELEAIHRLLARYRSARIGLADACLVRMTELHSECLLLTVDGEFRDIYRRNGRQSIPTLMPPGVKRRTGRRSGFM